MKLFDLLAEGPLTAADIAARLSVPLDSTERLLEAAVSLRLVEKRVAGRFGLGSLGAALVGNPAVGAMVEHHSLLYADLHDPVGLLRGERRQTELAKYWTYTAAIESPPRQLPQAVSSDYTSLMANSQPLVSGEILDAFPLGKYRCLLDVGGGDGSFLVEAGKRHKNLELMLFDLPPVAERAARRFQSLGLDARARAVGGDFLSESLPAGPDIVSLVRVVHDHDDAAAMTLLRAACRVLPPKGVLLLAEPMMGTPGAETVGDAYFGFYLLAMGRGRPRSPKVLQQMLQDAGFADSHLVGTRQPLQSRLIVARTPAPTKSVKQN